MMQLLLQVFQWWIVLFILGCAALPFTTKLFTSFFDKGYGFTKTIGIILITYAVFLFGTLHILPFETVSIFGIVGIIGSISILFGKKWNMLSLIKESWGIFLFEEIVFIFCLLLWSTIKGFQPDIHGLEKFMDYGFINSILRSTYFPPKDMWMTPLSINYYYFGHLITAVLTKLSFLPSNSTFNLMLATLFASTFIGGFSIGANLIHFLKKNIHDTRYRILNTVTVGLLTAFLLTFGGNLHTIYTFFLPYQNDSPVPPLSLAFSPQTFPNQYWYPNATRFIFHTIHEFPMYSFVVSDLHGHVLDIPFVLLTLALLLVIFLKEKDKFPFFTSSLLLGAMSGVMYMTNAWDGLIYCGVSIVLLFGKLYKSSFVDLLFSRQFLVSLLTTLAAFVVVSSPFSVFFKPFASQIGINCAPEFLLRIGHIGPILFEKGYCQISPLWQLGILYGFFFFWIVSFFAFLYVEKKTNKKLYPTDIFVAALNLLGLALIILPEFVYLKDIYTTYFRANTMFKLVYQAFIILSLTSGYTIVRLITSMRRDAKTTFKKVATTIYLLLAAVLTALVIIYSFFATTSYFNAFKNFQGLNGTRYLKNSNADDYAAILWLNSHIKNQPIILEAQGDSYTDYARVSSNTGLPTIFGWTVHEWLWRGTYDIAPQRIADIKTLYESTNIDQTKQLLRQYNVSLIFIGSLERSKYIVDEEKFTELGKSIFTSDGTVIYKIK